MTSSGKYGIIITESEREVIEMKSLLLHLAVFAIVLIILFGVAFVAIKNDIAEWNNGYCECGGVWEAQGFHCEGRRHNVKRYDYRCDSCGKYIDCLNQMEIENE